MGYLSCQVPTLDTTSLHGGEPLKCQRSGVWILGSHPRIPPLKRVLLQRCTAVVVPTSQETSSFSVSALHNSMPAYLLNSGQGRTSRPPLKKSDRAVMVDSRASTQMMSGPKPGLDLNVGSAKIRSVNRQSSAFQTPYARNTVRGAFQTVRLDNPRTDSLRHNPYTTFGRGVGVSRSVMPVAVAERVIEAPPPVGVPADIAGPLQVAARAAARVIERAGPVVASRAVAVVEKKANNLLREAEARAISVVGSAAERATTSAVNVAVNWIEQTVFALGSLVMAKYAVRATGGGGFVPQPPIIYGDTYAPRYLRSGGEY